MKTKGPQLWLSAVSAHLKITKQKSLTSLATQQGRRVLPSYLALPQGIPEPVTCIVSACLGWWYPWYLARKRINDDKPLRLGLYPAYPVFGRASWTQCIPRRVGHVASLQHGISQSCKPQKPKFFQVFEQNNSRLPSCAHRVTSLSSISTQNRLPISVPRSASGPRSCPPRPRSRGRLASTPPPPETRPTDPAGLDLLEKRSGTGMLLTKSWIDIIILLFCYYYIIIIKIISILLLY